MTFRFESKFEVGRFTCEMVYDHGKGLASQWTPHVPKITDLTKQDIDQYRAGRDALLARVAKKLGGNVLVAEI